MIDAMFKYAILSALFSIAAIAQTGSITVTAPAAGRIVAIAGSVTCAVAGNTTPATTVTIACTAVGPTAVPTYTIPLPANASYTFTQGYNGDLVTFMFSASAAGVITWQAAATPKGGTEASNTGTL